MQVAVVSAISNFVGNNHKFKQELVKSEKHEPNGGRSFEQIFADAKRKVGKNEIIKRKINKF